MLISTLYYEGVQEGRILALKKGPA